MLIRVALCFYAIACRLIELRLSRRNIEGYAAKKEGAGSRASYPVMVAMHVIVLAATLLLGGRVRRPYAATFLLVQPLRFWIIQTAGRAWNTRGAVPSGFALASHGPYRFVAHPNYTVVAIEVLTLPCAFGLYRFGVLASLVNAALLAIRIRDEEALLLETPGYSDYLRSHPRFIPNLV